MSPDRDRLKRSSRLTSHSVAPPSPIYPASTTSSDPRRHPAAQRGRRPVRPQPSLAPTWSRATSARRPERGTSLPPWVGLPPAASTVSSPPQSSNPVMGTPSIPSRGRVREEIFARGQGRGRGWGDFIPIGVGHPVPAGTFISHFFLVR
jgi:hypothetical protein